MSEPSITRGSPQDPSEEDPPGAVSTAPSGAPGAAGTVPAAAPGPAPAAPIADDQERRLDPRYVLLHRVIGGILAAAILAGVAVAFVVFLLVPDLPGWLAWLEIGAGLAIAGGLGWFFHVWPAIEHRHASYKVGPRGIEIRRGVVWRKVISVPRSRVQHTDVSQGPIERRFGLATLRIHTAGTVNAEVDLAGLDHGTATAIRDHLVGGGEDDAV